MRRRTRAGRTASRKERRNKTLAGEVTRIRSWLSGDRKQPLHPSIEVPGWLVEALGSLQTDGGTTSNSDAMLLAHVIGLRLKIARDLAARGHGDHDDLRHRLTCQAELMLDSALGVALQRETQSRVDAFIGSGQSEQARRWGALKSELFQACARLRDQLTHGERERAANLTEELSDEPAQKEPVARPQQVNTRTIRRRRRRRNRAVKALELLPSRTELLLAAAAMLAIVWFGFVRIPASTHVAFETITLEHFAKEPAIVSVEAYPPSLIVAVDDGAWQNMTIAERDALLRAVSSPLKMNGYRGAFLKSEEGKPLAQWMAETGSRVFAVRTAR